ncbi:MAG: tagaturonate epimerase family protein [Verrucomicrobia bacterium]|nr:tagaturonate epimerase family protein [Verrucomicrobiota bacterium]
MLDTATWDRVAAWRAVRGIGEQWAKHNASTGAGVRRGAAVFDLVRLPDGQQVFVELGQGGAALGQPLGELTLKSGLRVAAYPTDAAVVDRYCRVLRPHNRPRALGATPRLGIGCRMTTLVWPGMFDAMRRGNFAANTIQNSVRELNFLDDLLAARPAPTNYACGFGTIETGYTGSTWEGLWVGGVLAALQNSRPVRYGADADHLQVKRGAEGLARARRLAQSARYYTFYTLDMADILDYSGRERRLRRAAEQRMVLACHREPLRIGRRRYALDERTIGRLVGKYWDALEALADLADTISILKDGEAFDLEFTIDEHPPEVAAFDCLTTADELLFVLREIRRRGLPVTHIAPNLGQEKGYDYRCPDGLAGLEKRLREQLAISDAFGVMLDVHSADDLSRPVRQSIRRATGGRIHYKISPSLQILFAETLADHEPGLFREWWKDARAYARREAEAGSAFAAECLRADEKAGGKPSARGPVFHHFSFAFVGRRDPAGRFLHRERFYSLPETFGRDYGKRVANRLCGLAEDLFSRSER